MGKTTGQIKVRRKVNMERLMSFLGAELEYIFTFDKKQAWRNIFYGRPPELEDYFPSEIERVIKRMERKGWVVMEKTDNGTLVKITEQGKSEVLKFQIEDFHPKTGDWDGKWRIVFFDVGEYDRKKRDRLRKILRRLGMKQLQKSIWISPYEIEQEIKFVREVLEIPHDVKLGLLEKFENEDELKTMFNLT